MTGLMVLLGLICFLLFLKLPFILLQFATGSGSVRAIHRVERTVILPFLIVKSGREFLAYFQRDILCEAVIKGNLTFDYYGFSQLDYRGRIQRLRVKVPAVAIKVVTCFPFYLRDINRNNSWLSKNVVSFQVFARDLDCSGDVCSDGLASVVDRAKAYRCL